MVAELAIDFAWEKTISETKLFLNQYKKGKDIEVPPRGVYSKIITHLS